MKILAFVEQYPSVFKGYFDAQFAQFIRDGHDLTIIAHGRFGTIRSAEVIEYQLERRTQYVPSSSRDVMTYVPQLLGELFRFPVRRTRGFFTAGSAVQAWSKAPFAAVVATLLPLEPPDVCLLHGVVVGRPFWWLNRLFPSSRLALYYHGGGTPLVPLASPEQSVRLFEHADVCITNTAASAAELHGLGCPSEKISVVPVGIDIRKYAFHPSRRKDASGALRLVTASRLSPEKGHRFLLEALARIRERGVAVSCRITGVGIESSRLEEQVRALNLTREVSFLGHVSEEQLVQEFQRADLMVHPSITVGPWTEAQGVALQEAMLTGLPVIASDSGGLRESVCPELRDWMFPPSDVAVLTSRLLAFAALDEAGRSALARAGRRFVEERYNVPDINRRLLAACMGRADPTRTKA